MPTVRRIAFRSAIRPLLRLVAALTLLLALSGCREKMVYNVAGADLPDLASTPGTLTTSPPTAQGVSEALTFNPATISLHEDYVAWLAKNGWSRRAESQEVTLVRTVMAKEGKQLILTFTPSTGLSISGTRPK